MRATGVARDLLCRAILACTLAAFLPVAAAQAQARVATGARPTLAVVGGRIIDGYGGPVLENGVILVAGERILAVGREGEVTIPPGTPVIDANGHTVMPGLIDMHVHLHIVGHGDYKRWDDLYGTKDASVVMPIAARQLLSAGVTSARDLGARLDDILTVKRRIAAGEIPGPRLFVSGPFIQHAAYEPYEEAFRWGVTGADDARQKVQRIIDAGVDVVKLIDQDQMTDAEVAAVVATAHKNGKPVVAHAHRMAEIRVGLKHGVDNFEHTGLGTAPGYPDDVLQQMRERNSSLYWTPTVSPLFTLYEAGTVFPERLDDPSWRAFMPNDMGAEIRRSL
ncbi:MAG TPA: amidohydrolase family protein, partial [Gemmatimonadaceae bacterium]|nr:amidohydrolase family protein [Gemmatimonadaceae bacterium]